MLVMAELYRHGLGELPADVEKAMDLECAALERAPDEPLELFRLAEREERRSCRRSDATSNAP
jgi:hypothetical protein